MTLTQQGFWRLLVQPQRQLRSGDEMKGGRAFWLRRLMLRAISKFAGRVHGKGPLLVAIGDSHTDPRNTYAAPWNVWLRRVARRGYRTVNLGFSGATTRDMRITIKRTLDYGMPVAVILFGGVNDAVEHLPLDETAEHTRYMLRWLHEHGVERILVIGTAHLNLARPPDWARASLSVREVLREVASEHHVAFLDLNAKQQAMIESGEAPDFTVEPYSRRRSWYAEPDNQHFNARGQRLLADMIAEDLLRLLHEHASACGPTSGIAAPTWQAAQDA
jgi:lysophospholipase L1-like esterase